MLRHTKRLVIKENSCFSSSLIWPHACHRTLCCISYQASLAKGESIYKMAGRTRNTSLGLINYRKVKSFLKVNWRH